jgi:hypothetical protein
MTFGSLIPVVDTVVFPIDVVHELLVEISPMTFGSLICIQELPYEFADRPLAVEIPPMTFGSLILE